MTRVLHLVHRSSYVALEAASACSRAALQLQDYAAALSFTRITLRAAMGRYPEGSAVVGVLWLQIGRLLPVAHEGDGGDDDVRREAVAALSRGRALVRTAYGAHHVLCRDADLWIADIT